MNPVMEFIVFGSVAYFAIDTLLRIYLFFTSKTNTNEQKTKKVRRRRNARTD